ncbi:MAG: hypothetical protein LBJ20_04390 [Candidatus Methanoplasma sp.]|jgi:hypothetical protein|nr:hypothetical protein [Candidatus Methanoplasma sp.]
MDGDTFRCIVSDKNRLYKVLLPIPLAVIIAAFILGLLKIVGRDVAWTMVTVAFAVFIVYIGETYMSKNRDLFRNETDTEIATRGIRSKGFLFRLALWIPIPVLVIGFILFEMRIISFTDDLIVKVAALAVYCAVLLFIFTKQKDIRCSESAE